ncbi:MAG TPA: glucose-6-phosphate dehydrogenase, partial [Solirubrobacterales bacterium]|nr:glucose-6-phosphate dehydrogenase [Solirubrobacterales bacterium]
MSTSSTATLPAAAADAARAAIPDPHVVVLFGASGDLAARKLLPGFFHLEGAGLLPDAYRIVGTATDDLDDEGFVEHARKAIQEFSRTDVTDAAWDRFAARLSYVPISAGAEALGTAVTRARQDIGGETRLLHYLAVPPAAFESIIATLRDAGLNGSEARVILEKPFGHDYESAVELNEVLHGAF